MGKKLLNEATVRKFMKLANIDTLASSFVNETYYAEEEEIVRNESNDKGEWLFPVEGASEPTDTYKSLKGCLYIIIILGAIALIGTLASL